MPVSNISKESFRTALLMEPFRMAKIQGKTVCKRMAVGVFKFPFGCFLWNLLWLASLLGSLMVFFVGSLQIAALFLLCLLPVCLFPLHSRCSASPGVPVLFFGVSRWSGSTRDAQCVKLVKPPPPPAPNRGKL